MLRIHPSNSVSSAKSYYSQGLARGDYYGQEAGPGVWFGKAAAMLGLEGEVASQDFCRLCDNQRPDTGAKLNPRENQNRRVGYDLTFSANKGTSLLLSVYKDQRVLRAFQKAVTETMELVEENIHVRVRRNGETSERKTGNIVSAMFTHLTSRPVQVGSENLCDPQLHCHSYSFATTWDEEEGRFKSADFFHIKRDGEFFEGAFHSKMARELQLLGYEIINRRRGFEIRGISQELIDGFSRRTAEIEELAQKLGISGNHKAMEKLGARTRAKKLVGVSKEEMQEEWIRRAKRIGNTFDWETTPASTMTVEEAVDRAIDSKFERLSVVRYRQLLAEALQNSLGSCSLEEIEAEFATRDDLITRHRGSALYTTTKEILAEEEEILSFLARTKGGHYKMNPRYQVSDTGLDQDQRGAIEALMKSSDRVFVIEGKAGSGKTTMMRAAVAAMEFSGEKVACFAPTSEASHHILREEGFTNSETIQRFLLDEELQRQTKHCVLWIDEAGLLSTKDMRLLLRIVEMNGNRIVLSGDSHQHSSVGRGDFLRLLVKSKLVEVRTTRTVYRQKCEKYKLAVQALSCGDPAQGIGILDEMGAIRECEDFSEKIRGLADDYVESLQRFKSVLIISPTHLEGQMITQQVRKTLKENGMLGEEEIELSVFRSRNLTESEKRLSHFYDAGDVICFHRSVRGQFKKGQTYIIEHANQDGIILRSGAESVPIELPLNHAECFDVGSIFTIPVASGEKLRLTRNVTCPDGRRLYNGSLHQLKGWNSKGELVLKSGHHLHQSLFAFDYGHVSTSYSSQGKTVEKVILSQGSLSRGAATMEQFYVSASRGRSEISVWVDDKMALLDSVRRSGQRMLASELITKNEEGPKSRQRDEELALQKAARVRRSNGSRYGRGAS